MVEKIKYYRLCIDLGEFEGPKDIMGRSMVGTCELYLKVNGQIKKGDYFAYSAGCFPKPRGSGSISDNGKRITLAEITKKVYEDTVAKI